MRVGNYWHRVGKRNDFGKASTTLVNSGVGEGTAAA